MQNLLQLWLRDIETHLAPAETEPALEPVLVLGAALALELVLELEVAHQPCSGGRSSAIPSSTIHLSFLCLATRNGCEATAGW